MPSRTQQARAIIAELAKTLPAETPIKDRRRAVRRAYPWGARQYWAYRAWLKAQKEYLKPFEAPGSRWGIPLTPLEIAINRTKEQDAKQ